MLDFELESTWAKALEPLFSTPSLQKLQLFLSQEFKTQTIFPQKKEIFTALNLTPLDQVKVVILGQDPYHGEDQAHGLAFSVQEDTAIPPSLVNIYTELHDDIGCAIPKSGDLTAWAKEGVLLLNTVLTVRAHQAHSHKGRGWEAFTDEIIRQVSTDRDHCVFILWGKPAQQKKSLIDSSKHLILEAPHPSPLSSYRGFFGSKPFSKTNSYLKQHHKKEVSWCL